MKETEQTMGETFISSQFIFYTKGELFKRVLDVKTSSVEFYDLHPESIQELFDGLILNKTIIKVDLSYNGLGDEWAPSIARLIREKPELCVLNLCMNGFTISTLHTLLPALQENNTLQRIMLGGNIFYLEALLFLLEGLTKVPRLSYTSLQSKLLRTVYCGPHGGVKNKIQIDAAVEELASVNPYFFHILIWHPMCDYDYSFFISYRQEINHLKLSLFLPICPLDPIERFLPISP